MFLPHFLKPSYNYPLHTILDHSLTLVDAGPPDKLHHSARGHRGWHLWPTGRQGRLPQWSWSSFLKRLESGAWSKVEHPKPVKPLPKIDSYGLGRHRDEKEYTSSQINHLALSDLPNSQDLNRKNRGHMETHHFA